MTEEIYNLFVYADGEVISHIGIRAYKVSIEDSDEEKCIFLQKRSLLDHVNAHKTRIANPITLDNFRLKQRTNTALEIFEALFQLFNASHTPLYVMTIVVNGESRIDNVLSGSTFHNIKSGEKAIDYLSYYSSVSEIDFMQMFEDDYFKAIKLLYNNRHIVSCAKLLMIFVDTVAFVEFGDKKGNFKNWLDTFAPLDEINLEANELWEFRNSLLHMSNLDSRAVLQGKVMRLIPSVNLGATIVDRVMQEKEFDLKNLLMVITKGVGKWMGSYNTDRQKFTQFIERYDTVISDFRVTRRPV